MNLSGNHVSLSADFIPYHIVVVLRRNVTVKNEELHTYLDALHNRFSSHLAADLIVPFLQGERKCCAAEGAAQAAEARSAARNGGRRRRVRIARWKARDRRCLGGGRAARSRPPGTPRSSSGRPRRAAAAERAAADRGAVPQLGERQSARQAERPDPRRVPGAEWRGLPGVPGPGRGALQRKVPADRCRGANGERRDVRSEFERGDQRTNN